MVIHPGLIMGHQVQDTRETHQVFPRLQGFIVDDLLQEFDTFFIIPRSKIQTPDLIIEDHDMMLIKPVVEFLDLVLDLVHQRLAIFKIGFHESQVELVGIEIQESQGRNVVVVGDPGILKTLFQILQYLLKQADVPKEKEGFQKVVVPLQVRNGMQGNQVRILLK